MKGIALLASKPGDCKNYLILRFLKNFSIEFTFDGLCKCKDNFLLYDDLENDRAICHDKFKPFDPEKAFEEAYKLEDEED